MYNQKSVLNNTIFSNQPFFPEYTRNLKIKCFLKLNPTHLRLQFAKSVFHQVYAIIKVQQNTCIVTSNQKDN